MTAHDTPRTDERAGCGCVIGSTHRYACASVGHVDRPADERAGLSEAEQDMSLLLRATARQHLGFRDGDHWPSDVADAQARAVERIFADRLAAVVAERDQWKARCEASWEREDRSGYDRIMAQSDLAAARTRAGAAEAKVAAVEAALVGDGHTTRACLNLVCPDCASIRAALAPNTGAVMGLEAASQPAQGANRAAGEDECHQGADDDGEARP